MAQFDVFRLKTGQLVVDLQTDLIGIEASRIVAPLRDAGRYAAFPGLTPKVEIDGAVWIVRVQELAAIPGAELGEPVTSLAAERDVLKRALDILIDGVCVGLPEFLRLRSICFQGFVGSSFSRLSRNS